MTLKQNVLDHIALGIAHRLSAIDMMGLTANSWYDISDYTDYLWFIEDESISWWEDQEADIDDPEYCEDIATNHLNHVARAHGLCAICVLNACGGDPDWFVFDEDKELKP